MHIASKEKNMNTFRRIRDIIASNISSALDKAEDPEKMIDLSIREAEELIQSLSKSIAEDIAERGFLERKKTGKEEAIRRWEKRAELAVEKELDTMAREAITEKLAEEARLKETEEAIAVLSSSIESLQKSRARAEEDLRKMRAKSEEAKARGKAAKAKMKADGQMARCSAHYSKFEDIEKRMAKWEIYTEKESNETAISFEEIERDAEITRELNRLKAGRMEA